MKSSYNCAQADLYMACRNGWWMCQKNLAAFAAVKPKYTEGYVQENLDAIDITDLLPDVNARYEQYDLVRLSLIKCNEDIQYQFMILLSYIDDAFSSAERDIMYRSCGNPFLTKAKKDSWPNVAALLSAAVPFLEKYKDTLETTVKNPTVKNNMPADFVGRFKALAMIFNGLYKEFKVCDVSSVDKTSEKVEANNMIYKDLLTMFEDAKRIFNNNAELKNEFTFVNVLTKARGTKMSGIIGKVINAELKASLAQVQISIRGTEKIASSDKEGRYEIAPLTANKYTVIAEADGYEPSITEGVEIKTGSMSRVNFELVPKELLKSVA